MVMDLTEENGNISLKNPGKMSDEDNKHPEADLAKKQGGASC